MRLIPVSERHDAVQILWELLAERPEIANISHKGMPTFEAHAEFVSSHPYEAWYLIEADGEVVGATYLTRQSEIGIAVFRRNHRKGYAEQAVRLLMATHSPRRYLANVAPGNAASHDFWWKMRFVKIQETYALEH